MVLAICIGNSSIIGRLVKLLRNNTYRTNHGKFFWRSNWDESIVNQHIALSMLKSMFNKKDRRLFLAIYDTQILKRAKKKKVIGKLRHHVAGKYGTGHTILKVCLYYRDVTIPWASLLYVKQERCDEQEVPFYKLIELADCIGRLSKLGAVRIVFSRRKGENKHIAIVTDYLSASMIKIVADYLKRWCIEILIKDEKQHLGLGYYRVLRYRALVRHLYLVDCVYACLIHLGLNAQSAQGQNESKKALRLEPISKLKDRMRRTVWQENVKDVIKYSHEKPVIRRLEKLLAA